jgi:hypothetical protein
MRKNLEKMNFKKMLLGEFGVKLILICVSALIWSYVAQELMGLMQWSTGAVEISFYVALGGALIAFLMERFHGKFRKIFYESMISAYIDLIICAVPLVAIYLLFTGAIPLGEKVAGNVLSSPFALVSAWVFSFSIYKTLHRCYEQFISILTKIGPDFKPLKTPLPPIQVTSQKIVEKATKIILTAKIPITVKAGENETLELFLKDSINLPIIGENLTVYMDGKIISNIKTDLEGKASASINVPTDRRNLKITVEYPGRPGVSMPTSIDIFITVI